MSLLRPLLNTGRYAPRHAPWPRAEIDAETWRRVTMHLAAGDFDLLALWGEPDRVHLAVQEALGQLLGQRVRVSGAGTMVREGTARGLAADGALLLETEQGLLTVHAGDVSLRTV